MQAIYDELIDAALRECRRHYGDRLISLAAFGSVGRGTPAADSDIDLLLVADPLPRGRLARSDEFVAVDTALAPLLTPAHSAGLHPSWSVIFKTPAEVTAGSPLFLDMIDDARIVYDHDGFLAQALSAFSGRLARLGAKRIWRGNSWYWDLKPDYQPGEVFEL